MSSIVTVTTPQTLYLRLNSPQDCSKAFEEVSKLFDEGQNREDPISQEIHHWFAGALRMVVDLNCENPSLRMGGALSQDQQAAVLEKVKELQARIVNPLKPNTPLEKGAIDEQNRVWEVGRTDFPSLPHFEEVQRALDPDAPSIVVEEHTYANRISQWAASFFPPQLTCPLQANHLDQKSIMLYWAAYLSLGQRAVQNALARQEEMILEDATLQIQSFREETTARLDFMQKATELAVLCSKERLHLELQAFEEFSDLRADVITGRLTAEETRHTATKEHVTELKEENRAQRDEIHAQRQTIANLASQVQNMSGSSGISCTIQ